MSCQEQCYFLYPRLKLNCPCRSLALARGRLSAHPEVPVHCQQEEGERQSAPRPPPI